MLLLKDLNRRLECTDVSFNPENGETDRQSDYCNPLRARALRVNKITVKSLVIHLTEDIELLLRVLDG